MSYTIKITNHKYRGEYEGGPDLAQAVKNAKDFIPDVGEKAGIYVGTFDFSNSEEGRFVVAETIQAASWF